MACREGGFLLWTTAVSLEDDRADGSTWEGCYVSVSLEFSYRQVGCFIHIQKGLCPFNHSCDVGGRNPSREFKGIFPGGRRGGRLNLEMGGWNH